MSRIPLLLFFFLITPTLASTSASPAPVTLPAEGIHEWRTLNLTLHGTVAPEVEIAPLLFQPPAGKDEADSLHIHQPGLGWNVLHITDLPEDANLHVLATHPMSGERALVRDVRHVGPSDAVADLLLTRGGEWHVHVTGAGEPRSLHLTAPQVLHREVRLTGDVPMLLAWTQPPDHPGVVAAAFELFTLHPGEAPAPLGANATVDLSTRLTSRGGFQTHEAQRWHPVEWDPDEEVHRTSLTLETGHWDVTVAVEAAGARAAGTENLLIETHTPLPAGPAEPTGNGHRVPLTFTQPGAWSLLVHDPLTGLHHERTVHVEAARPQARMLERQTTPLGEDFWGRAASEGGFRTPHHRIQLTVELLDADGRAATGVPDVRLEIATLDLTFPLTETAPASYRTNVTLPEGLHTARFLAPSLGLNAANATWFGLEASPQPQDTPGGWGPIFADPDQHEAHAQRTASRLYEHSAFAFAIAGGMMAGVLLVLRRR